MSIREFPDQHDSGTTLTYEHVRAAIEVLQKEPPPEQFAWEERMWRYYAVHGHWPKFYVGYAPPS